MTHEADLLAITRQQVFHELENYCHTVDVETALQSSRQPRHANGLALQHLIHNSLKLLISHRTLSLGFARERSQGRRRRHFQRVTPQRGVVQGEKAALKCKYHNPSNVHIELLLELLREQGDGLKPPCFGKVLHIRGNTIAQVTRTSRIPHEENELSRSHPASGCRTTTCHLRVIPKCRALYRREADADARIGGVGVHDADLQSQS
mmetsp:Transcript_99021/g.178816  ORF Transcript_99021/g.178816 Transcript_99021/m.178816 type:complete len:206 (-) Transcript_99021:394-1011(-)